MTEGDRSTLLALEMLRRQVGGLPGEFMRAWTETKAIHGDGASAAPAASPRQTRTIIDGFDATIANQANKLAVQAWPRVIQLVNHLLSLLQQRAAMNAATAPRMIAGPREGIPLQASGTAAANAANAANAAAAKTAAKDDRAILDKIADALGKMRDAFGARTSAAFRKATGAAGRGLGRLKAAGGRAGGWVGGTRAGRAGKWVGDKLGREANSRTAKAGAGLLGRGAKAAGRGLAGGGAMLGKAMGMVLTPFAAKLFAILGPMALFAAVLSSATSGFSLVTSSVRILASVGGTLLLPFMVLFATGMLTLSDVLMGELAPGLATFYGVIMDTGIPVIMELITKFQELVSAIKFVIDVARNPVGMLTAKNKDGVPTNALRATSMMSRASEFMSNPMGTAGNMLGGLFGRGRATAADIVDQRHDELVPERVAEREKKGTKTAGNVKENLNLVMRELIMSQGPRASFSGLSQASRSAQIAALNQSPFEAKLLQYFQQTIGSMNQVAKNTEPRVYGRHEAPSEKT